MFEKLDMKTINFTDENIKKIAEIFPNVVSEDENGKVIDFEALKQELSGNIVEGYKERYGLNWPGKREAQLKANIPTTKTLRPCIEDSVNFETTENLYIEGDNLEVLKILQEGYLNKIKMIYIDPPYNTGKDFVYKDNFTRDSKEELLESGQIDEEGGRFVANLESNGKYHSDWLSMMYPRLKLARNLLKENGLIYISIDHNEISNLRKLCDEIYGENNFIGYLSVVNNLKGRSDDEFFATCNEYLLVYAKNITKTIINGFELDEEELDSDYDKQDEISFYKLIGLRKTGKGWERVHRPYMYYPILMKNNEFSTIPKEEYLNIYDAKSTTFNDEYVNELKLKYENNGFTVFLPYDSDGNEGRWRWGYERFLLEKDINVGINQNNTLCSKMRATMEDGSIRMKSAKTLWYKPEYDTGSSSKVLKNLFQTKTDYFDNPKSIYFLTDLLKINTSDNDIVLDFFSGSATTAHSIMRLNDFDKNNRKFIMVQFPEELTKDSVAYKNGYKNICEIGKERIRKAGKKIVEESGKTDLDIGFRVLKLDSSNMKDVYFNPNEISQNLLDHTVDNIKEDRSDLDLLFGVLIDWGVDLTLPINKEVIQGKNCYFVDSDSLCAYFGNDIDEEFIKELAKKEALRFVFKDSSFGNNDDLKDNVSQIFKQLNPQAEIKVI